MSGAAKGQTGRGTPPSPSPETVFVRADSHRARDRLYRALDYKPGNYYRSNLSGGYAYLIWKDDLEAVKGVKGVSRLRDQDPKSWSKCWG